MCWQFSSLGVWLLHLVILALPWTGQAWITPQGSLSLLDFPSIRSNTPARARVTGRYSVHGGSSSGADHHSSSSPASRTGTTITTGSHKDRPISALPVRKTTTTPARKKKKNVKANAMAAAAGLTTATAPYSKNNIKTMGQQLVPRRLDPAELAFHIHDMYLYGPGGSLRAPTTTPQTTTVKTRKRHGLDDDDNNDEDDDTIHANQIEDDPTLSDDMALKLARHPALVLNADYKPLSHLPLSVWSWQETIKSVFTGKVTVVEYYPDIRIRAATIEVPLPSVIALNEYVPQHEHIPAFTKRNVFLRDEYRCQYCHGMFHTRDLSLDHVQPRCRGGQLVWNNAVTCCKLCNGRKGSKTVSELKHIGMELKREPRTPTQTELAKIAGRLTPRALHPSWLPYLPYVAATTTTFEVETAVTTTTATTAASTATILD